MLKISFLALNLLVAIPARAQYDDLLRDPDVVWVAEHTADFMMNPENEIDGSATLNYFYTIRLQNASAVNGLMGRSYMPQFLSEQLLKQAGRPGFQAYADSSVRTVLSPEKLESRLVVIDTVIGSCDDLDNPQFFTVRNERSPDDIEAFRIRQVFWYDAKRRRFGSRFLAYAPVIDIRDNDGNWLYRKPLYWLKGESEPPKRRQIHRFAYVFQTRMLENAPDAHDFNVIKGRLDIQKLVSEELASPSQRWLDIEHYQPIDATGLAAICFGADTIGEYDDATGDFEFKVKPWNRIEGIDKIRFVQNWWYDERHNRLYCRLVGWAPMAAIRGDDGEIRYRRPLFYQMY